MEIEPITLIIEAIIPFDHLCIHVYELILKQILSNYEKNVLFFENPGCDQKN